MERRDDSGDSPAPRSASSHLSQLMQAITEENEEEPTNPPLSRDAATLPLQYEEESNPLGEEKSYLFVDNHDGTGYLSATQRLDDGSLALGETVMLARLESSTMTRGSPLPRDFQSPLPHQDRLQQYTEGETEEAERQLDRELVTRAAAPSRAEQSFSLCRLPADGSVCFDQTILLGQSFAEVGSPLPRSMASPAALEGSVWREGAPRPRACHPRAVQ
ncbi:hypothetical protein AGDE_13742 [Angomonas deanei]|nr:hypothetical protein AGDE_13742 [Angomonas deanei]|eukprot:EPY21799.1 hypothetical protein AGDE_13742 [Angomonas deanei]